LIRNENGALVGAVETLEDITEARERKRPCSKAHENLESKVRERTRNWPEPIKRCRPSSGNANGRRRPSWETTEQLSLILTSLPIVSFTCSAGKKL